MAASVAGGVAYILTADRERSLADTASTACSSGDVAPSPDGIALCDQAAQVQALPVPLPVDGTDGTDGVDGRGILGTSVVDGRLIVTFSDGATQDAGQVVGQNGAAGLNGRGITDSDVVDGRLMITYSDGAVEDLGVVIGLDGRGIASTAAVDGRLVVTYTDGDVEDAGPLPAGPRGDQGPGGAPAPSVQSVTRTYSDGSIERCTRTDGSDSDPVFDCAIEPPPDPDTVPDSMGGEGE